MSHDKQQDQNNIKARQALEDLAVTTLSLIPRT